MYWILTIYISALSRRIYCLHVLLPFHLILLELFATSSMVAFEHTQIVKSLNIFLIIMFTYHCGDTDSVLLSSFIIFDYLMSPRTPHSVRMLALTITILWSLVKSDFCVHKKFYYLIPVLTSLSTWPVQYISLTLTRNSSLSLIVATFYPLITLRACYIERK